VGKVKLLIIISVFLVFCFMPIINMPYDVVVEKQVKEEYTTVEPYIVQEEVKEPYEELTPGRVYWQREGLSGHFVTESPRWETKYRTVIKDVTKYREVTKTRLVTRPVVETRTKRVSILRYLLR